MSTYSKLTRGETRIDFVGRRRRWFLISAVLLTLSLASLGLRQLNLGIEFVGGLAMQSPNPAGADVGEIRDAMLTVGVQDATVQLLDDGASVRVVTSELDQTIENAAVDTLGDTVGVPRTEVSIEAVGPSFGALVARRALTALAVFMGAVIVFISWRLEFKMALAGITALFHDLLLTVGIYAITGFTVTPATLVAVLTILGYSLYDTVVVFDKVEELVEAEDQKTYPEIVNLAMNLVLFRSLNTSLTSLLPIGSILFVGSFVLGAPTLREFALALFVGITAGTYSSIFIAGPLLGVWKEKEEYWQDRAAWVARRAGAGKR